MLSVTSLSERPYEVDVWGRTSESLWRVHAAYTFAVLLEARFGGVEKLLTCFSAWKIEERLGGPSPDAVISAAAQAWRVESSYAAMIARRLLDPSIEAEFVVRLK